MCFGVGFFFSLFCFYIKRVRVASERLSVTAGREVPEASREMKQETLRVLYSL